jgi:hypothetical protein
MTTDARGPFLTVAWSPLLNAAFPLRDATDVPEPFLAVGYAPRLGTSYYPYDRDDASDAR